MSGARRLRRLVGGAVAALTIAWTVAAVAAQPSGVPIDDRGRSLHLGSPPARIVSLAPHATELLAAAGAGERLIAVDPHSDWPPRVRELPRVSAYPQIDLERLLALRPDLVLVWGEGLSASALARMEGLGLKVFISEPSRLIEVATALERIARALSPEASEAMLSESAGFAAARAFRGQLQRIESTYAGREPLRVFVQVWEAPLMSISDRSVMGDALRRCGVINVLGDARSAAPQVTPEAVARVRPQLILATRVEASDQRWRAGGLIGAAGETQFLAFDASRLERASPRMLDPLAQLCEMIDARRARAVAPRP